MTQGELEKIAIPIQKNMSSLESRIMSDIVRRIKENGEITSTADWQINRLYEMGVSKKAVKKMIAEELNLSKAEVKKLYKDALYNEYIRNEQMYKEKGKKWIAFDKNKGLQNMITSVEAQTEDTLVNITQSLGFAVRNAAGRVIQTPLLEFYQGTLDDAMMDIASGAFDYGTVLRRTIQTMTNSGLRTIDYDSGWSNRVDVAARRAVMTGFNQLQTKINEQVAKDLKTDYFEVSWHGGARPEHQMWQGKVYSRKQLETVCGLGSITGLCGANCYHSYNAFIPGVSIRTYTDAQLKQMNAQENQAKSYRGKEYTTYEALQQQRKMETLMRKQRQDIRLLQEGSAAEDDILAAGSRYRSSMEQYSNFSNKMGLPQQRDRVYQDGLGKKMRGNTVAKPTDSAIIKEKRMYRKKSSDTVPPMAKKDLRRITKAFRKQGGIIQMNATTDAYLDFKKAEAITYDAKTILLKQKPSRAAVFEELIHASQFRQGKNDGSLQSRLLCEIEAQEKLLKHSRQYKLSEAEIRQTEKALKSYQKQLEKLGGENG